MKTLLILFIAILYITFADSASHRRHHEGDMKNHDEAIPGSEVDWPNPGSIGDFTVPDDFTSGSGGAVDGLQTGNENVTPPSKHHGKSHHRSRRLQ